MPDILIASITFPQLWECTLGRYFNESSAQQLAPYSHFNDVDDVQWYWTNSRQKSSITFTSNKKLSKMLCKKEKTFPFPTAFSDLWRSDDSSDPQKTLQQHASVKIHVRIRPLKPPQTLLVLKNENEKSGKWKKNRNRQRTTVTVKCYGCTKFGVYDLRLTTWQMRGVKSKPHLSSKSSLT